MTADLGSVPLVVSLPMDIDDEILGELEDIPHVKLSVIPEVVAVEPTSDVVDRAAACITVVDKNALCKHSYLITVLCLRLCHLPTPAAAIAVLLAAHRSRDTK